MQKYIIYLDSKGFRMANLISILRVILTIIMAFLLYIPDSRVYWGCFFLTIIIIWLDGLDGYIARKFNETSKFGAVLDIIGDRVIESIYWIIFLSLGWLPVWVPLVILIRGLITDGLRSIALEQGYTAFGQSTMMESKVGRFLVASNFSRGSYAVFKATAFALLIAAHVPNQDYIFKNYVYQLAYISTYLTVIFCVLRGVPVLIESRRFFPKHG
jgi:CDP-diacylglycerol---glycerol-3-phosphate 3-phosphatidyltransferase